TKDNAVPVEHSRLFTSKVKVKHYLEIEDDHRLSNAFKDIVEKFL
ncbi:MAG TPA: alpha/beta hydrolase, partial [Aquificaceae bacterium]|nr:alpha/beta hydrolase [Aquificaceae bacterium]